MIFVWIVVFLFVFDNLLKRGFVIKKKISKKNFYLNRKVIGFLGNFFIVFYNIFMNNKIIAC